MNYTYAATGIVTSDPQIACMFLGEFLTDYERLSAVFEESRFQLDYADRGPIYPSEITIPYPLVKAVLKPVEGELWFPREQLDEWVDADGPEYAPYPTTHQNPNYEYIACNPITTGKTVGELRELIQRVSQ